MEIIIQRATESDRQLVGIVVIQSDGLSPQSCFVS